MWCFTVSHVFIFKFFSPILNHCRSCHLNSLYMPYEACSRSSPQVFWPHPLKVVSLKSTRDLTTGVTTVDSNYEYVLFMKNVNFILENCESYNVSYYYYYYYYYWFNKVFFMFCTINYVKKKQTMECMT